MPPARRSLATVIVVAVGVLALDQATKWWAEQTLDGRPPVEVLGQWLQLTFVRNPGGAFSLLTSHTWLFTMVATGVAIAILWYSRRVRSGWWLAALGVLLGGAVGNLVDRMIQPPGPGAGHVVDFIELPNWPVFNVADMAVVGGAIAIVVLSLLGVDPAGRETTSQGAAEPTPEPAP
ncbi:MAG: signal peptidase II [Candidatus Nanopelagicales bacterium]